MKRKMGEINDRTRPEFLLYLTSGQTIYPHSPEEGAVSELDGREKTNKQTSTRWNLPGLLHPSKNSAAIERERGQPRERNGIPESCKIVSFSFQLPER